MEFLFKLFNIHEKEKNKVRLMFLLSLTSGFALFLGNAASAALFLKYYEAKQLPLIYMIIGIVVAGSGILFTRLEQRRTLLKIIPGMKLAIIFTLILFQLMILTPYASTAAALLLAVMQLIVIFDMSMFWGLASTLFDIRESKRLYSIIQSGELISSVMGGLLSPLIITVIGTKNLLFFSAFSLITGFYIYTKHMKSIVQTDTHTAQRNISEKRTVRSNFVSLLKNPYIFLLFSVTVIQSMLYTFTDYIYKDNMKIQFTDVDTLGIWFAVFSAAAKAGSLVISGFITSRLLSRYGLINGLLLLPSSILIFISLMFCATLLDLDYLVIFSAAVMARMSYGVFWPSVSNPSFKSLFQTLPHMRKHAAISTDTGIIRPLGGALAGFLLLIMVKTELINITTLSVVILFVLAVLFIVFFILKEEYQKSLRDALISKPLRSVSVTIDDNAIQLLKERVLKSNDHVETVYSLQLLETSKPELLPAIIKEKINRADDEELNIILDIIERMKIEELEPEVKLILQNNNSYCVKSCAARCLCAIGDYHILDDVAKYMHSDFSSDLIRGAITGLIKYGGIEGILIAGDRLISLAKSKNNQERKIAALMYGDIANHDFYRQLAILIEDDNDEVREAALRSSGIVGHKELYRQIVNNFSDLKHSETAVTAAINIGKAIVPYLLYRFEQDNDKKIREMILFAIGRIGDRSVTGQLLNKIKEENVDIRYAILHTLGQLGYSAAGKEREKIESLIHMETSMLATIVAFKSDIGDDENVLMLIDALQDEIQRNSDRLFYLLGFLYGTVEMHKIRKNYRSGISERKALALEAFDQLVSPKYKKKLLLLLEHEDDDLVREHISEIFHLAKHDKRGVIMQMLEKHHKLPEWVIVNVLYAAGLAKEKIPTEYIDLLSKHTNVSIRETTKWTAKVLTRACQQ